MKRTRLFSLLSLLLALVLLAFSLTSCGGDDEESEFEFEPIDTPYKGTTLMVYNWGEYISDGSEGSLDVIKAFEAVYGIKVKYDFFSTNEELYAQLLTGASYDVVIPSDYMIERLIHEDLIQAFDPSELENYHYIAPEYRGLFFDPTDSYSVPYSVGMVGIVYDTTKVDPKDYGYTWSLLWSQDFETGDLINMNNPRDAFGIAMCYLEMDINSPDPEDWKTAYNKLREMDCIYLMDEIYNKMENGTSVAAAYYAGDCVQMMQENENLDFYYPVEGTNIFVDSMCIPKSAKNVGAAKLFIDFMLDPVIATQNANYICYASPNLAVRTDPDYDYCEGTDEYAILYELPESYVENPSLMQYYHLLDDDTQALQNDYWNRLGIEEGSGGIVQAYVFLGIVVLIFGWWITDTVLRFTRNRKKNRRIKK